MVISDTLHIHVSCGKGDLGSSYWWHPHLCPTEKHCHLLN